MMSVSEEEKHSLGSSELCAKLFVVTDLRAKVAMKFSWPVVGVQGQRRQGGTRGLICSPKKTVKRIGQWEAGRGGL